MEYLCRICFKMMSEKIIKMSRKSQEVLVKLNFSITEINFY